MKKVESSNIAAIGYKDGVLSVEFKSGATYDYHGVSPDLHAQFMSADSHGRFFSQHIRPKFDGKKRDK